MTSFLSTIIKDLLVKHQDLSKFTFILPSKRAGAFLKREISLHIDKPVFSPTVISIENFTEQIAGLSTIDNTTTLFEFFTVYKELTLPEDREDFETFSTWAQTLVHDFNEIDRYLIPPDKVFNYLAEIQDINHWSVASEKTELVENYLAFWKKLPLYYNKLIENLLDRKEGYQGLIYRRAAEKVHEFSSTLASNHIFIGFNALNNAEQEIIQKMLDQGSQVYWDIDTTHLNDPAHDAGLFLREYAETWQYYRENSFEKISTEFTEPKNINIVGIPKSIGQAKHVGEILSNLTPRQLQSTALVLGEESLLVPILNSLPNNVPALNITMGYPLKYSPFAYLFDTVFEFYKTRESSYYYKTVISLLSNPVIQRITRERCKNVVAVIKKENLLYLTPKQITRLFEDKVPEVITAIFPESIPDPKQALENIKLIIKEVKQGLTEETDALNLEFLYQYQQVTEHLEDLLNNYPHITSVSSLHHFYKEIAGLQALDFQGKPFQGLQLMGMLESRVLDFETVILTSVDEGILPAGKSNNSFIPYDLKKAFGLPTYKEKDAVYTYHFYHLLQRAKQVYLLHNTDNESQMGGEKSRFILQLEIDNHPAHTLSTSIVTPAVKRVATELQTVHKNPEIMSRLKALARNGFSPSALTTYVRNPLDFYLQYILKIRDRDEVEETVAYNTLGTVVHKTLETFYLPLKGRQLTIDHIEDFQKRTTSEVRKQFELEYSKIPLTTGKNLLIFEVARRYVINFLKLESRELKAGRKIIIREIEANLSAVVYIPELDFEVNIKGNVDRVDIYDDILRVIDYKTGKVTQPQLEICDWDELTTDYDKYSKPFQVLMYATMLLENEPSQSTMEAGVISFKNLKVGFLRFGEKESSRSRKKNCRVEPETIENFKVQLKNLIREICDPKIPFLEKEIKSAYGNY